MKTRRFLILLITAAAIGCGAGTWACSDRGDQASMASDPGTESTAARSDPQEITIRNVTRDTIVYRIRALLVDREPEEKSLAVDSVNHHPGETGMDITFMRQGAWVTYRLDPGHPYSFRYDENGDLELYDGSHGREDVVDLAPFVATPMPVVEKMLEMARVTEDDLVFDLGCGDGRIVITAAKKYGASGVGIDLDPERIAESRRNAREAGVEGLVEFRIDDVTKTDLSPASVVTIYLLTESNELLRPMLEKHLKPGTRVISHNYDIPGWESREIEYHSIKTDDGAEHSIYLYRK